MTNGQLLSELRHAQDVMIAHGADDGIVKRLTQQMQLPAVHLDLLKLANGLSTYGGYFRLFGCSSPATIDMLEWNAREQWTFAWNKPLGEFWFFGETAWGDQYAYRREELRPASSPRVYFLEAITMNAHVIADDFSVFLEREFLGNALRPYDDALVAARRRLGNLAPLEHVVHVPSPLITGDENLGSVSKLDAVASMIISGDLCNQLADQLQDRVIKELQPYVDSDGRTRMRVVWRDAPALGDHERVPRYR